MTIAHGNCGCGWAYQACHRWSRAPAGPLFPLTAGRQPITDSSFCDNPPSGLLRLSRGSRWEITLLPSEPPRICSHLSDLRDWLFEGSQLDPFWPLIVLLPARSLLPALRLRYSQHSAVGYDPLAVEGLPRRAASPSATPLGVAVGGKRPRTLHACSFLAARTAPDQALCLFPRQMGKGWAPTR